MHSFFVLLSYQLIGNTNFRIKIAQVSITAASAASTVAFNLMRKAVKTTTKVTHNFPGHFHHIFTVLSLYCGAKEACLQGCRPVLKASVQNPL